MGQLEDLFLTNFDVTPDTLVDRSSGQPINAWKFENEPSRPFFETPEFVGYIDSALYRLTEEFSEICTCDYDSDSINGVLEEFQEAQISKRVTELFGEEVAVEMVDHMFNYSRDVQAKTERIYIEATRLLQPLMSANRVSSLGLHIVFDSGGNYDLEENNPLIPAINFSYGYQLGWDTFEKMYNKVKVVDHESFAEEIIKTYFTDQERSLPFMFPDLAASLPEIEVSD